MNGNRRQKRKKGTGVLAILLVMLLCTGDISSPFLHLLAYASEGHSDVQNEKSAETTALPSAQDTEESEAAVKAAAAKAAAESEAAAKAAAESEAAAKAAAESEAAAKAAAESEVAAKAAAESEAAAKAEASSEVQSEKNDAQSDTAGAGAEAGTGTDATIGETADATADAALDTAEDAAPENRSESETASEPERESGSEKESESESELESESDSERESESESESESEQFPEESAADWEASVSEAQLTGDWNEDLVAVAATQVGYEESTENVITDEDGVTRGYTRYGAWYGEAHKYEAWSAMFVSFCLNYAEIPESAFPRESDAAKWQTILNDQGLYFASTSDDYEPAPGDLIFFQEGEDAAVHVGIVERVSEEENQIFTIEGDRGTFSGRKDEHNVARYEYDRSDEKIAGYGSMEHARNQATQSKSVRNIQKAKSVQKIIQAETEIQLWAHEPENSEHSGEETASVSLLSLESSGGESVTAEELAGKTFTVAVTTSASGEDSTTAPTLVSVSEVDAQKTTAGSNYANTTFGIEMTLNGSTLDLYSAKKDSAGTDSAAGESTSYDINEATGENTSSDTDGETGKAASSGTDGETGTASFDTDEATDEATSSSTVQAAVMSRNALGNIQVKLPDKDTLTTNDALTFTLHNANAITKSSDAGTVCLTLESEDEETSITLTINIQIERVPSQINVSVPLVVCMYAYGGDGKVVTPDETAYSMTNQSSFPVQITSIQGSEGWELKESGDQLEAGEIFLKLADQIITKEEANTAGDSLWRLQAQSELSGSELYIPIQALIAGGNVNEEGESQVCTVTYTAAIPEY